MNTCYMCPVELTEENSSKEHIILNAMGGRLKPKDLLCKTCNSKIGHDADSELAKQFEFLSAYLQVKRDSGSIPIIRGGKTKDGTEINL